MALKTDELDLWRQVSNTLADEIAGGSFAGGDKLPASSTLAKRFGVHQHTVLKAISHLQQEGILRIERGRGTFVAETPIVFKLGAQTWFEQNLIEGNHAPSRRVISLTDIPAPSEISKALSIPARSSVTLALLLGEADGIPVYYGRQFFATNRIPGITRAFREFGDAFSNRIVVTEILARLGFKDVHRHKVRIRSRMPKASEASQLRITRSTPLLETVITISDENNTPIAHSYAAYCSNRIELIVDL